MAVPTSRFRLIPNATTELALDTEAERLAAIASQSIVSTGVGNEADFGEVDVSDGADNSNILTLIWDITADGGFTNAEQFKIWMSSNGFDQAGSVCKFQALSGADQAGAATTENYVENAVIGSYTWGTMPESEPAQNVFPSDEETSMVLSTASDDVIMWAMYLAIAALETAGTYKGTDAGNELQFSFKYSYS